MTLEVRSSKNDDWRNAGSGYEGVWPFLNGFNWVTKEGTRAVLAVQIQDRCNWGPRIEMTEVSIWNGSHQVLQQTIWNMFGLYLNLMTIGPLNPTLMGSTCLKLSRIRTLDLFLTVNRRRFILFIAVFSGYPSLPSCQTLSTIPSLIFQVKQHLYRTKFTSFLKSHSCTSQSSAFWFNSWVHIFSMILTQLANIQFNIVW